MQKIISLFQRNHDSDRLVRNELTPGAEWVVAGEGVPTRKWDGTCCLVRGGKLYKRYEFKRGKRPPANFEPACDVDSVTGKQQGWLPVGEGPEDRWHREAWDRSTEVISDGTYELIGPKIRGNPEGTDVHQFIRHGEFIYESAPTDFGELRAWLASRNIEGIVWHHPDGRMVKIKARDFGIQRQTV